MKKKALVFGYHGMKNLGDDFFLDYCIQKLKKKGFDEIYVSARKGALDIAAKEKSVIPYMAKRDLYRGYDKWLLMLLHAAKVNCLIFCAGSLFTSIPARLFYFILKLVKKVNPNIKIYAIGVSIGPFPDADNERIVLSCLAKFDRIITRDSRSVAKLENAAIGRDLAFCAEVENYRSDSRRLGVCINQSSSDTAEEKRSEFLSDEIKKAYEFGYLSSVLVFATCSDKKYGDIEVSRRIYEKLRSRGIPAELELYSGDWTDFVSRLSSCDKVIASRLHAGFFSLISGASVFQLKYAVKNLEFYDGLDLTNITFSPAYNIDEETISEFIRSGSSSHFASNVKEIDFLRKKTNDLYDSFWAEV